MKDLNTVRANEKIKRGSTLLGAGGLTLLGSGLARLILRYVDLTALVWILLGAGLIFLGVQVNDLLESEDME